MKTIIGILLFILPLASTAQQDCGSKKLITLTNGYQVMGTLIETETGDSISIIREVLKDTLRIAQSDIAQINFAYIGCGAKNYLDSLKMIKPISPGYNSKPIIMQLSTFLIGSPYLPQGGSIAVLKSYRNFYQFGGSFGYATSHKITKPDSINLSESRTEIAQLLLENKFRLSNRAQHKRGVLMYIFNCGYTFNMSYKKTIAPDGSPVRTEKGMNAVTTQHLLGLRLNTDDNSGFLIEAGITYLPLRNKIVDHNPVIYRGHTPAFFPRTAMLKISYFF
jgi:hypothetical protein